MSKKKIEIAGFDGPVSLKKKILKPLTQDFESRTEGMRPGESSSKGSDLLKDTKDLIKELAADGKLGNKDLSKIQSFASSSSDGFHYEAPLLSGTLAGTIDASRYSAYVSDESGELRAFREQQGGLINQSLQQSLGGLNSMLSAMSADAGGALSGFKALLDQSMSRMKASVDRQQRVFDRQNARSERNIERYQKNVAKLPKPPKPTKMIGKRIDEVDAGKPFKSLAMKQAPVRVQTAPAFTGFNLEQQESRARQMQGLSGFRSSRA
jgi:hypothetical protein